jgi:2-hydroxy-6-oxonona-2,4-dienedioate hydrolase
VTATLWTTLMGVEYSISFRQIGEWRTRIVEAGRGEPLVLLHGTGGHLEAYARNIGPLSEHFRVVAFDFAGHGLTTHADRDLEIADYVAHTLGVIDALGIPVANLSGESLGGWVAARLAARNPGRVRRMVLNTPGGTLVNPAVMDRIRTLSQAAADDPSEERIRARLEWLMADPGSVTDELVAVRRALYSRPGFARSMAHLLCLQDETIRRRNLLSDDELAAITAPTLIVWTSDDPSGPAAEGRIIRDKIPGADFALIEGAGHWPQWEQTETFNRIHIEFLGASQ